MRQCRTWPKHEPIFPKCILMSSPHVCQFLIFLCFRKRAFMIGSSASAVKICPASGSSNNASCFVHHGKDVSWHIAFCAREASKQELCVYSATNSLGTGLGMAQRSCPKLGGYETERLLRPSFAFRTPLASVPLPGLLSPARSSTTASLSLAHPCCCCRCRPVPFP